MPRSKRHNPESSPVLSEADVRKRFVRQPSRPVSLLCDHGDVQYFCGYFCRVREEQLRLY